MANDFKFECNSEQCKEEIKRASIRWLHKCGMVIIKQILDIYRNDTGQTKNSFDYIVDESELSCTIGSPMENAIWEEFGTGIEAENGNGRKSAWSYKDARGNWHKTKGKKGTKAFRRSFDVKKKSLQDLFADMMRGLR